MNHSKGRDINGIWEKQILKEKEEAEKDNSSYPRTSFKIFISSIAMQAMIALGKLEAPVTGKTEKNIDQARFLIDTLIILEEKTRGNLTEEEDKLLRESVLSLKTLYVDEKNDNNNVKGGNDEKPE